MRPISEMREALANTPEPPAHIVPPPGIVEAMRADIDQDLWPQLGESPEAVRGALIGAAYLADCLTALIAEGVPPVVGVVWSMSVLREMFEHPMTQAAQAVLEGAQP